MFLRQFLATTAAVAVLAAGLPAFAQPQQQPDEQEEQLDEQEEQLDEQEEQLDEQDAEDNDVLVEPQNLDEPFNPGNTDLSVMGGVGNLLYLWVEPGVDFGLFSLGEGITVSAGGGLNAGWCAICGLASLMPGVSIAGWYLQPTARATVHFNQLGALFDTNQLDSYAGLASGVAIYSLSMETEQEPDLETGVYSFLIGPILGARWTFDGADGLFAAAELRLLAEFGQQTFTVRTGDEDEDVVEEGAANVARQGFDLNVGIGFRF